MCETEWLSKLADCNAATTGSGSERSIDTIAIVTKDRPPLLERCIASLVRNLSEYDRACRICVYDDSSNAASEAIVRAAAKAQHYGGITLEYAGPQQKRRYIDLLTTRSLISRQAIEFLLTDVYSCGPTYGANLNWILLGNIGRLIACLDDDMICKMGRHPDQASGGDLSSEADPTLCRVYADRRSALDSLTYCAADFLGLHERLIGKSVPQSVLALNDTGKMNLSGMEAPFVSELAGYGGSVVATMLGVAGDSGTSNDNWFELNFRSRRLLWSADLPWEIVSGSHEVVRCVPEFTVTDKAFFMSGACSMDNAEPLPPFFPVLRNQDGVFATLLRRCCPGRFIGYIPWVVVHDPPPGPAQMHAYSGPRLSEILLSALTSGDLDAGAWGAGCDRVEIGRRLERIGNYGPVAFRTWITHQCLRVIIGKVQLCKAVLARHPEAPREWRTGLSNHIARLEGLLTCGHVAASDLHDGMTPAGATALTQRLIAEFGRALYSWDDLRVECGRLQNEGIG